MKALYDIPAPAKLNLFLHITGRRSDGYHLLQSVFMLIDWCDTLHFELRRDGLVSREDLGPALPPDDLTLRAARALQAFAAVPPGVHIAVHKQIPVQAGMGGGSSDAASCLLALNRLWDIGLPLSKLEHIGLQLGADVPFFLRGHNAWVQGIGEEITPLTGESQLPAARFAVLKPQAGLETRPIFEADDLKRDTRTAIISGFAANPFGFGQNDLQPVAQRLCPEVAQALEWLAAQGLRGRMTGSGSAVFAQLLHETDLTPPAQVPTGWAMRTCSNLDVHPLVGWAPSDD
ncbi:MAG: 4-(cytidine 5'-diphospho)-2-C-methyl-D-erythritol kinase [Burkholderiaceae bacterium]|nr:MAG: 4-(cytidine 5'-diphospho)-2-C-methyl-D-erythritol kinase [Burkholderiaceae bacterium]